MPLVIQKSFSAGEWAPELNARVDLAKYHSAAALLRNFFVDYRGGASTCPGTKYILQALKSSTKVRLIPFQASFTVNYVLEFGDFYIRFFTNGGPVLESAFAITAINIGTGFLTAGGNNYQNGDWVFITGIVGTVGNQLNGNYYVIANAPGAAFTLVDLFGNAVTLTGAYTSGGTVQRVYTLTSPFAAADLALVKFTQSVNTLILCHPSYAPQVLTLISAANWTITAITFGPTIAAPTALGISSANGGSGAATSYVYAVTAVDQNGQESAAIVYTQTGLPDISGTTRGTIVLGWTVPPGAVSFNAYKAVYGYGGVGAMPSGLSLGFIGNCTSNRFVDDGIAPDFSQTVPVPQNPFAGGSVISLTLTGNANYTVVPSVIIAAPGSGLQATGYASLGVTSIAIGGGGFAVFGLPGSPVGQAVQFGNGVVGTIATATFNSGTNWTVNSFTVSNPGSVTGAGNTVPANPVTSVSAGLWSISPGSNVTLTWQIGALVLTQGGFGYTSAPAVTFSAGGATANSTLGPLSSGNPSVPGFFDQRLVLAAQAQALQTFYMSQPGSPYNFNTSNPIQADDAITGSIVSGKLNAIKSMLAAPTGLIMFTSQQAWLVNGGANGASVTPIDITATGHAYNGASDVPPIQINFDFLYVQSKGSIIRDLTFNFYTQIYTGTDISVLSSHLFFGRQVLEWAYAEVPFSLVWAVRDDGILLCLTYVKEQEVVGWTHRDTKGLFKSVASIPEAIEPTWSNVPGTVDAVYVVVQRTVNGQTLQYIERIADRFTPYGAEDCWALDAAISSVPALPAGTLTPGAATGNGVTFTSTVANWNPSDVGRVVRIGGGIVNITAVGGSNVNSFTGNITKPITYIIPDDSNNTPLPVPSGQWSYWVPATTFTGLQHLIGQTVTALADGVPVTGLVVSATGSITLPNPASKVIVGLPFTPQLKTLAIDVGDPTIQSKLKNIPFSSLRVRNTLGLSMGRDFSTVTPMKDLVLGAVGSMLTGLPASQQAVSDLYTGDARTFMDSAFTTQGQYCIQQDQPYYATVLGTIPALTVGG